jgi:hypothetical protein
MSRSGILVALVTLAVGGALGYVLGSGGARPPEMTEANRATVVEPPTAPDLERDAASSPRAPRLEIPTGDGVIAGRVALGSGVPLEGVLVRATLAAPPADTGDGRPPSDEELDQAVRAARLRRASRREARSGPDGTFRLTGLADRSYRLEAWCRGYTISTARYRRVRPGGGVDLTAAPRSLLTVSVKLPGGGEPEEATVTMVQGRSRRDSRFWTPRKRTIPIRPGRYEIHAFAGAFGELRSEKIPVVVREGEEPEPLEIRLEARPGIRGRVLFEDGVAEQGAIYVGAAKFKDGVEPDESELRGQRRSSAPAGGGYAFVLADLEPGEYRVGVFLGWELRASARVTVGSGMVEQDVVVPTPGPGETKIVRVVGPDAEPVVGATFGFIRRHGERGIWSSRPSGAALADGTYRIRPNPAYREQGSGGRCYLHVTAPDLGVREVEIDMDDPAPVTVAFESPGCLVVRLAGVSDDLREDLTVSLAGISAAGDGDPISLGTRDTRISKGGERRFEGLQAGRYKLYVWVKVSAYGYAPVEERPVNVGPGETVESLTLPRLHRLTILVEGRTKTLQLTMPSRQYSTYLGSPQGGRIVLRNLPAGRYGLTSYGSDAKGMTVDVPAASEVRFEGRPLKAMLVRIRDERSRLARAGLRAGDLIVGVDGQEFLGQPDMQGKLMVASQKERARLSVVRDGRTITMSVPGKLVGQGGRQDPRGWLEPTTR